MADSARHPNLNLTPEEKRVFYQLFQAADTTNLGVITGEVAVPFFEKTQLAPETLGLIWQIADRENRGLLTPSGFGVVLRLIGHAQAGRAPTDELALQPAPIPRFDGIVVDPAAPAPAPAREAGATSPPPAPGTPIRVPPLNPEDVNKFLSLFEKSDVSRTGVMPGEAAKQIFERARLPNDILGRIWNLADVNQRGALDATEFIIAMHLLTSYKAGSMRGIPQTLPPGLYDAAARRGSTRSSIGSRPGLDVPPVPAIPKQFTGPQRTQSPINRQQFGSPLSAQSTGGDWLITPQEKVHFDGVFATIDAAKIGMISGDQAVGFFIKAQLPEETLAQIWDLADIDADGQLTKDEFAVAMYLVRQQRTGKEPLPQALPPALIPPSMRRPSSGYVAPAAAPAPAPAPAQAPAPAPPRSAADDLFGLDSLSAPAPPAAAPQIPQSTGGSNVPFPVPASPTSRASPPSASTTFKPFVPTSSFGQSIQPQMTGASAGAPPPVRSPPPPSDDLLGDNDPEESSKLTQETTELANLSNQIGSLANEMQNVQTKRTVAEQDLSQTSQQKRDFETRLAQARTMYEQEVKNFKALEERLNASRAETNKLQQEFAMIDGSRQDLQNQYDQVSAALTADQQENASLKEKIRQANAIVAQLKPALEKARSEARQQKGLAAINKKQLSTVEGEQTKIQEEIDGLSKEQPQEPEEQHEAPVSAPAAVASPAASTASQNTNPFFKRTATGSSEGHSLSPQISNDQQRAFDSLFGPSFTAQSPSNSATPPPPTSFRADSQPTSVRSTSGAPTPSVSPPPSAAGAFSEPPAPAQSRQLTPSGLPFGDSQSATSSTMVSPPASRFGGPDASSIGAGSQADTSDSGPTSGEAGPTSAPTFDETEESKSKFPEVPSLGEQPVGGAASPTNDSNQPGENDPSFDELFGGPAHQRSRSQKENDFEEAFASMRQGSGPAKTNGAAESEFPPIHEIDDDDDDDSTDSESRMGFDDNFTPSFPPQSQVATQATKPESIEPSQLAAFPSPGTASSPVQPPAADSQTSPPKYEESTKDEPESAAPEFNGLLPHRADPTTAPDAPHSVETGTGAPIMGGEPQPKDAVPAADKKAGAPDFEAAFAGLNLAPAKESDDDDDDDSETPGQKNNADFDFSFDTPSQQKPTSPGVGVGPANPASSDFFNFDPQATSSPGDAAAPSTSPNAGANAQSHDWEALFAPLDNVSTPGAGANGAKSGSDESSKPPGWALQTGTEDDQFLQRLTGMGFPREESLIALEKFDYNLDKAVDHLTSKS
ncbi:UBA/TS-N domain protein [Aspergillus steynii IBT 23096]|uniref:Actin cytoskeleton-regulatory complex protein END3 n=1 Tax=Aspergillus steynii IBT 23096 TaxID=1392250 RepID=A0A2I2FX77_9EURO|nr:UBA/TS-N domain protein [Aspergillus steynii IBT 23096]PLB45213.1 UBA/TS-N domain protein [Aspergillus steynii IBT 23096]